jgi:hypothetical protein
MMQIELLECTQRGYNLLIGLDDKIEKIVEGMGASNHIEFVQSLSNP